MAFRRPLEVHFEQALEMHSERYLLDLPGETLEMHFECYLRWARFLGPAWGSFGNAFRTLFAVGALSWACLGKPWKCISNAICGGRALLGLPGDVLGYSAAFPGFENVRLTDQGLFEQGLFGGRMQD